MKRIIAIILVTAAVLLTAQTPKVLTNQDVLDMVSAKLSDSVILAAIHKSTCKFSTNPEDLIALHKAGVSDAVIEAMTEAGSSTPAAQRPYSSGILTGNPSGATPSPGGQAAGDPNDPMAPHDSGIYLYTKDRDGKPEMIALERAAEQAAKRSGGFGMAMTYGIKKMKTKAVIPGAHAEIQVNESSPVFYFYFDDKQAGLGKTHFGVNNLSNPNQFALLKLEVKNSDRETVIGEIGAFGGGSSGSDTKAMVPFKSERIRPGLYKVSVENMQPGEYCFLAQGQMTGVIGAYGGASAATDIFDFGVNTK